MNFGVKVQPNPLFASMQRTYNPTYVSYYGDGTGRDQQIIINNGGLTHQDKYGLGHHGVHLQRYNSNVQRRRLPGPGFKKTPSFAYLSDGSGRDSYVLMDSGGLRPEYDRYHKNSGSYFTKSLRSFERSPLKSFTDVRDKADITTYLNWKSREGYR